VVENVLAALDVIPDLVQKKWAGIQSIFLKSSSSAALPIYTKLPEVPISFLNKTAQPDRDASPVRKSLKATAKPFQNSSEGVQRKKHSSNEVKQPKTAVKAGGPYGPKTGGPKVTALVKKSKKSK